MSGIRLIRFECGVRYALLSLLARKSQKQSRTPTDSIRGWCAIGTLVSEVVTFGQKITRLCSQTSRRQLVPFFGQSPFWTNRQKCQPGFVVDTVDVRYLFLYLLARKSQHASSHIDRVDSPVDVRYLFLYLLARKITTCIIAHRPIRFASQMYDIWFCISWPEILQHASSPVPEIPDSRLFILTSKRRFVPV